MATNIDNNMGLEITAVPDQDGGYKIHVVPKINPLQRAFGYCFLVFFAIMLIVTLGAIIYGAIFLIKNMSSDGADNHPRSPSHAMRIP